VDWLLKIPQFKLVEMHWKKSLQRPNHRRSLISLGHLLFFHSKGGQTVRVDDGSRTPAMRDLWHSGAPFPLFNNDIVKRVCQSVARVLAEPI
jgi:hypothetical protein